MSKSTCCRNPCVTVYCTDLGTDHFRRCLQGWAFGCVLWWNDFCGNAESIHSLRGMVQIMPRSFHYSRRSWERAKKENSSGSRSAKAHVQMDSPISAGWTIRCHNVVMAINLRPCTSGLDIAYSPPTLLTVLCNCSVYMCIHDRCAGTGGSCCNSHKDQSCIRGLSSS